MDTTQLMMASGGMLSILIGLLMLLLPIILLLIAWRILKWSSTTALQVTRLTEQMDELIRQLQQGAPATAANIDDSLDMPPDHHRDEIVDKFAGLTAAPAVAAAPVAESYSADEEIVPAASPSAEANDSDVTSFEFPVGDEETFGDLAEPQDDVELPAPLDTTEVTADPMDESEDFSFDVAEDEPGWETADEQPAVATAGRKNDFFTDADEDRGPLAGAFGSAEEEPDRDAEADTEDRRMEESFDTAFPAAPDSEEPAPSEAAEEQAAPEAAEAEIQPATAEESPAIVQLDDDPARPEVSLARCCQCEHKLAYKKTLSGKKARCPSCKGAFVLP